MSTYQIDPYVVRWGLHQLLDEMIARVLQEELSRVAQAEASGVSVDEEGQSSIHSQNWCNLSQSQWHSCQDPEDKNDSSLNSDCGALAGNREDLSSLLQINDEYVLDNEVGKRLHQMVPVPHVPKVNGDIPTIDEATSDRQRLFDRLKLYDLVELKVSGDGNWQPRKQMLTYQIDPDIVRWGRQQLVDGWTVVNSGSFRSVTQYTTDVSQVVPVTEGFVEEHDNVENDEIIARALQEELSRVAQAEASGVSVDEEGQSSILSQNWCSFSQSQQHSCQDPEDKNDSSLSSDCGALAGNREDLSSLLEINDEYVLDSEVGKRLNQMIPVPHVPKVNGDIPTIDKATSDHQRLLDRYGLVELKVSGDGNLQPQKQMLTYQIDPDIVRWGLHQLVDGWTIVNSGSFRSVTQYTTDLSQVVPVTEGFVEEHDNVENDEIIARALQEELSRVAQAEASGVLVDEEGQSSILSQNWCSFSQSQRHSCQDPEDKNDSSLSSDCGALAGNREDLSSLLEINDEYVLDSEVGKRLNQMIPVPHVPKVNGDIPTIDEATSDHQRLLDRLKLYDLVELKVSGDGNCQFRALSDQFYRSPEHHRHIRQLIVDQLKSHPELYEGYVPMSYGEYLKKISRNGEWGDHITLQASADLYGVKIFVLTSFKDTCYIEILPHIEKSKRVIFLSFWAEVHYNSIYPEGEFPVMESKKMKKWWML